MKALNLKVTRRIFIERVKRVGWCSPLADSRVIRRSTASCQYYIFSLWAPESLCQAGQLALSHVSFFFFLFIGSFYVIIQCASLVRGEKVFQICLLAAD